MGMARLPSRQFILVTLLAAMGSAHGAQNMSVFKVDPVLLGLPPATAANAVSPAPVANAVPATPSGVPLTPPAPVVPVASPMPQATVTLPAAKRDASPPVEVAPVPGSAKDRRGAAVYVAADDIQGKSGVEVVAKGSVDLRKADSQFNADQLTYREVEDQIEAAGNVRLRREGEKIAGPHLKLKIADSVGTFDQPNYEIAGAAVQNAPGKPALPGRGTADRIDFEGPDRYKLTNATYSTCSPGPGGLDWFARVSDMSLDYQSNVGEAHDATVVFKGVPLMYTPWLSFPLNRERKSGLLVPTFGSTTLSGAELTVPYYINIAPDMDATVAPRFMTKRGVQLRGDFRYLGPDYSGEIAGEYLPNDQISHRTRTALSIQHQQAFAAGLTGSLNVNRVSDDTYFTDLSTRLSNISQTALLREGRISYSAGWWSASLMAQRYQMLQDPAQPPVLHPYERLPQIGVSATRPDLPLGLWLDFKGDYTVFDNPTPGKITGRRAVSYPQLSLPFQTAGYYVTPKIGLHSTRYDLDNGAPGTPNQITRNVPIVSIDSGATFERDVNWFGHATTQTLEPRLYYLRTPYRDQSALDNPKGLVNFDSGLADFNFAQIFSENVFAGNDRIADANQATLAVTSRVIDPGTGGELAKVMIGERFYFSDQRVTLPGVLARTTRRSDFLAATTAQVDRALYADSAIQYNSHESQLERFNLGMRYQPEVGKLLNAGYRYTHTLLNQFDVSGQWPIFGGWSGVGRYNHSFQEHRPVEIVAGLEYNEACWAIRFVTQHLATTTNTSSTAFFVQLELSGFSSLGSSPADVLKRNVPGYGRLGASAADPLFNY